jgi:hypothetical protein
MALELPLSKIATILALSLIMAREITQAISLTVFHLMHLLTLRVETKLAQQLILVGVGLLGIRAEHLRILDRSVLTMATMCMTLQ